MQDWFDEGPLAPYAATSAGSLGRVHAEQEHPFRPAFTRDRDRVVHSAAFRRLESKTQVFSYFENDYYRTRLTHTIEVAQISRTLSRLLGLNVELAEAVALSHDLGHPPFGHAGERALNQFVAESGTEIDSYVFNHNIQGLRIVDFLENKYAGFLGLNLSFEVREAFAKHGSGREFTPEEFEKFGNEPTLEAQVADLSDAIAYNAHDLDDGLTSGLLIWEEVLDVPVVAQIVEAYTLDYRRKPELAQNELVRRLINLFVTDAWEATRDAIRASGVASVTDVRAFGSPLARMSPAAAEQIAGLKRFLQQRLYSHPRVLRTSSKATHILVSVCRALLDDPAQLPRQWSLEEARIPPEGTVVRIVDYLASLTDSSAVELHKQLFDPSHGIHR